jgi:cardiolipin synthase
MVTATNVTFLTVALYLLDLDVLCQVVPSGPGFPDENNLRLFNSLIYSAQRRLSITSPYLVPDESLLYAITTAAQRGIDVELFVGEQGDQFMVHHAQCSYYTALLRAGVKIYLYPAPFVLHSKHFSVDDEVPSSDPATWTFDPSTWTSRSR